MKGNYEKKVVNHGTEEEMVITSPKSRVKNQFSNFDSSSCSF